MAKGQCTAAIINGLTPVRCDREAGHHKLKDQALAIHEGYGGVSWYDGDPALDQHDATDPEQVAAALVAKGLLPAPPSES